MALRVRKGCRLPVGSSLALTNMNALHQTFWQWLASLSEYADERLTNAYMSELFSAYCAGQSPERAARLVAEIDRRVDL